MPPTSRKTVHVDDRQFRLSFPKGRIVERKIEKIMHDYARTLSSDYERTIKKNTPQSKGGGTLKRSTHRYPKDPGYSLKKRSDKNYDIAIQIRQDRYGRSVDEGYGPRRLPRAAIRGKLLNWVRRNIGGYTKLNPTLGKFTARRKRGVSAGQLRKNLLRKAYAIYNHLAITGFKGYNYIRESEQELNTHQETRLGRLQVKIGNLFK